MTTTIDASDAELLAAIKEIAYLDEHMWFDIAKSFGCTEAEVFAGVLRALGRQYLAAWFIYEHSLGDEECDLHFGWDEPTIDNNRIEHEAATITDHNATEATA